MLTTTEPNPYNHSTPDGYAPPGVLRRVAQAREAKP